MKAELYCPICNGKGRINCSYDRDIWEPVYDPISGYVGWEYRYIQTGVVIVGKPPSINKECFNCEGKGIIIFEQER